MKCYAKVGFKDNPDEIRGRFDEAGIDASELILDDEVQQKKQGSVYSSLKKALIADGEPLLIDSLFSLGKNAREITKELKWFIDHDIEVSVLDIPSTRTDNFHRTELLYEINSIYAAREIAKIKAGQKDSSKRDASPGRPRVPYPKNWEEEFDRWEKKEITSAEFMEISGLSQGTFYNLLRRYYQERKEEQGDVNSQMA